MQYNHRELVRKVGNRLIVDEDKLNLFWKYKRKNTQWNFRHEIKLYNELKRTIVDIETSGLNPDVDRIYAIGARNENGAVKIFMHLEEQKLLKEFVYFIHDSKPEILFTYNGTNFDLPFIVKRCQILKIQHPFKISSKEIVIPTAKPYGYDPLKVKPVYIQGGIEHVDLYICVLRWDNTRRNLSEGKSLKKVTLEMGLREEERLVLDCKNITKYWQEGCGSNGWELIKKYLEYDLEDTALIANRIIPSFYYEKYIVPNMGLGEITIKGNGTKWSKGLQLVCSYAQPKPERKYQYQGGLTYAKSGLFKDKPIAQCDIKGMHPWIIANYGLFSKHDTEEISLAMLDFFGKERERVKNIPELCDRQEALKTIRNCYYGLLGTGKLAFNDMEAAALVCAYSRRLLKLMVQIMETAGAKVLEYDTDGIYFTHDNPQFVHQQLIKGLPSGIEVKLENFAKAMFLPENGCKNYLLWSLDNKVIKKGSWASRAKSKIENQFPIEYLSRYIESPSVAKNYHLEILDLIQSGEYPIDDLVIRRRIRENESQLLHLGKPRELVSYYVGINGLCKSGKYSKSYYCKLINEIKHNLIKLIAPKPNNKILQLKLF